MTAGTRLKFLADVQVSSVDKKSADGEVPVRLCNYTDVYYRDRITADVPFMEATAPRAQVEKFRLQVGQTLITKDSETADDIGVPAYVDVEAPDLVCGYHLAQITPTAALDSRFLFWFLSSDHTRSAQRVGASGVTRFGLRTETIHNLRLRLPVLAEQRRIAAFLDRETERIDRLIAAKVRMIELASEHFRSAVSEQVDQGQAVEVRRVIALRTSGPRGWGDRVGDKGSPFIRSQNLRRDGIELDLSSVARVEDQSSSEAERSRTAEGDVLIGITGANTGWVGLVRAGAAGGFVSQHVAVLRPAGVNSEWLALCLFSHQSQAQLLGGQYGGTKTQLGLDDLAELRIRVPSAAEQVEVVRSLYVTRRRATALERLLRTQVELLQQRRRSLITGGLTGEMEVP